MLERDLEFPISKAIAARGEKAFRFDTDRFPTEILLDVYYGDNERLILADGEQEVDLQDVSAVWYRRIAIGAKIPTTMDGQMRQASVQESRVTIQGVIASIRGFHLDPLPHIRRAENKQLQIQVARKLGLD